MNNINLLELKEQFNNINDKRNVIALSLIEKAIFLEETLARLEYEMKDGDVIQDMPQGNYSIKVVNPVLKSYNTTIKNYQTLMKQINELLNIVDTSESDEDKYPRKDYEEYVKNHTDWINQHKENNLPLTKDDKYIMTYDEWKDKQKAIDEEFFF